MRNGLIFLILVILIVVSFLLWGEHFTALFSEENAIENLSKYGSWAWMIGIGLLMADLFLPLPATIIMSALGFIYGPLIGGLTAVAGNFLSGLLAYLLCRSIGKKGAHWILGRKDFDRGHRLFSTKGGWIVALSRWLPILPEAIACMAGLNRMGFRKFAVSLFCGSLPLGFIFAWIGYAGIAHPYLAILVSAFLPLLLWVIAQYFMRRLVDKKSPQQI